MERTPAGGFCIATLLNDYHFNAEVPVIGKHVEILGKHNPKLTFGWQMDNNEPGKVARLASFRPFDLASFRFRNLDIELPADPPQPFLYTHMNGLISQTGSESPGHIQANFVSVNFYLANGSTRPSVFGRPHSIISTQFSNCTFPTNFKGRVREGVGGDGVDPATVARLIQTNLSWI